MRRSLSRWAIVAVVGVAVTYWAAVEFSAFAFAVAKGCIGVGGLYYIIKYAHDEIDAIYMYREYPLTYAAMLVAYALVIAASLIGS